MSEQSETAQMIHLSLTVSEYERLFHLLCAEYEFKRLDDGLEPILRRLEAIGGYERTNGMTRSEKHEADAMRNRLGIIPAFSAVTGGAK